MTIYLGPGELAFDVCKWPKALVRVIHLNGSYVLPPQLVDATHALNLSAGVSNSKVFRGRSLSWRATAFSLA